jgi:2-succinyl-5-enolpyruvyl-6-hydroxy-3-cyclohexene-1-carboxylate synthase
MGGVECQNSIRQKTIWTESMKMDLNVNLELTRHVLEQLLQKGVREFCVCPGKRNAPFVAALSSAQSVRVFFFYEERCAAFFALGRIKASGRPVAVITTSGTAVAELLPATMEAYYSGLPLFLITADRPRSYRGSGAPQAAEQLAIFGVYSNETLDLEGLDRPTFEALRLDRPSHINVCFDEPMLGGDFSQLLSEPIAEKSSLPVSELPSSALERGVDQFISQVKAPLVLVGMVAPEEREGIVQFLTRLSAPVYLESTSGLREDPRLGELQVFLPDGILELAGRSDYPVDGIIRIGGIPTLRLWRDLESKLTTLPVLGISRLAFTGLARESAMILGIGEIAKRPWPSLDPIFVSGRKRFVQESKKQIREVLDLLADEPLSEPSLVYRLSQGISATARVYLGNSMPIREWDLAASLEKTRREVWASRGVNGIDGQVSTFSGFAQPEHENWAILGDLTALYDLPGPWILSQLPELSVNVVVINNGGGKIFDRMFTQKVFQNPHSIRFKPWAELWGMDFEEWREVPADLRASTRSRIIEIIPDNAATTRFWSRYSKIYG